MDVNAPGDLETYEDGWSPEEILARDIRDEQDYDRKHSNDD